MNKINNILLLDPTENNQEIIQERGGAGLINRIIQLLRGKPTPKPKPRLRPTGSTRRSLPKVNWRKAGNKLKDKLTQSQVKDKIKKLPKNVKNWILKNKIKSGLMTWTLIGEYINDFETLAEVTDKIDQYKENQMRWLAAQMYDDHLDFAVHKIKSSDADIELYKKFFTLYDKMCYQAGLEGTEWTTNFPFQHPGTYCVNEQVSYLMKGFVESYRSDFIEEFFNEKDAEAQKKIVEKYYQDFSDTISKNAEDKSIVAPSAVSKRILNILFSLKATGSSQLENPFGLGFQGSEEQMNYLKEQQLNVETSNYPCFIDAFPAMLDFPSKLLKDPELFLELAKMTKQYGPTKALESFKSNYFVEYIIKNDKRQKKWIGFTLNATLDPNATHPLDYWTGVGATLPEPKKESSFAQSLLAEFIITFGRDVAIMEIITSFAKEPQKARTRVFSGIGIFGVEMFMWWDPLGWTTIQDEIEEELEKTNKILIEMSSLVSVMISNVEVSDSDSEEYWKNMQKSSLKKLISLQSDLSKSQERMLRYVHNKVYQKVQDNPTSDYTSVHAKAHYMSELQILLEDMIKNSQNLNLISEDLDVSDQQQLEEAAAGIAIVTNWHKNQLKGFKEEDTKKIDSYNYKLSKKLLFKTSLDKLEQLRENKKLLKEESEKLHEKYCKYFKSIFGIDPRESEEKLSQSRAIRDRVIEKAENSGKKIKSILNSENSFNMADYAGYFLDWWSTKYNVGPDRNKEKYHVYDAQWAQTGYGLKTNDVTPLYSESVFLKNEFKSADIQAIAAIGLSYYKTNTSFYYFKTMNDDVISPYGETGSLFEKLKKRSEVNNSGGSQISYDDGIHIGRLKDLFSLDNVNAASDISKIKQKWKSYIKWLRPKVTRTEFGSEKIKEYSIAMSFAHLAYIKERSTGPVLYRLIQKDEEISKVMENFASKLITESSVPGSPEHIKVVSMIRKAAAIKLALFEAAMSLE